MADPTHHTAEDSPPGSPRARRASTSLQAAATLNAGLQQEVSRRSSASSLRHRQSPASGRRRSAVIMNLQLNDPSVPAPGEMVSENHGNSINGLSSSSPRHGVWSSPTLLPREPHHQRAPSLGELHQELEAEQEAQVNRLLHMIRQQQLQLQQLQAAHGHVSGPGEETSVISERSVTQPAPISLAVSHSHSAHHHPSGSFSQSPRHPHPRSSFDLARADLQRRSRTPSRGASRGASPRLRSTSISGDVNDGLVLSGRDESAFYQAETQMLVRENQMLKHRIRELEKQLSEAQLAPHAPHEPANHSHLTQAVSATDGDASTAPRGAAEPSSGSANPATGS